MLILRWLANLKAGLFRTPQQIHKASRQEAWSTHADTLAERFIHGAPTDAIQGWPALDRLTVPPFFFTERQYLAQSERADWQLVNPDIKWFAACLIEELRKKNLPFFVHAAFRTQAEQHAAFQRGHSKAKWPRAPHCQGEAVDIVHSRYAWDLTTAEWSMIGKIGKNLADRLGLTLTWGGDFKSIYDPAHWEVTDWRSRIRDIPETGTPIHKTPRFILKEMAGHSRR